MSMHCSTTSGPAGIQASACCWVFRVLFLATWLLFSPNSWGQDEPASEISAAAAAVADEAPPEDSAKQEGQEPAAEEPVADEPAAEPPAKVTALVGARVMTMADAGIVDQATILIRDGKIEAIGAEVTVPEGAEVIDLAGLTVTPGWIDLRSTLWLTADAAADTGSTAAMDAVDGVDPFDDNWQEVARQGITSVYVQPAPGGTLGGYGAVLRVAAGDGTLAGILINDKAGFQSSIGISSSLSTKARIAQFDGVKKRLSDAKEYKEAWDKYRKYQEEQEKKKAAEAEQKKPAAEQEQKGSEGAEGATTNSDGASGRRGFRGGRGGPGGFPPGRGGPVPGRRGGEPGESPTPSGNPPAEEKPAEKPAEDATKTDAASAEKKPEGEQEKPPEKPKFDPLKERLLDVLSGKVPLRLEVHRGEDALRALQLAKEFSITLVLSGLSDLGSAADEVTASGVPVVLGPWLDELRRGYEGDDRAAKWASLFNDYDGRVAIASFGRDARASKSLRQSVATAIAAGFDEQRALEGVTTVPAALLGMSNKVGALRVGSDADLAVFAGSPLDCSVPVVMTFSKGDIAYQAISDGKPTPPTSAIDKTELLTESPLPSPLPANYVLRTERLLNEQGELVAGCVVVREGKIVAVEGADYSSEDLPLLDAGQAVVTPGLVTAHASLLVRGFEDSQGLVDSGPVRAADVFDPESKTIDRLVAGGFLRAAHASGSQRVIAGPMAEVRLGSDSVIVTNVIAEKMVLSSAARNRERFPSSLTGQQQLIRDSLKGTPSPVPLVLPAAAVKIIDQTRMERRDELTTGARPVVMLVEDDTEVLAAIRLSQELGLKATLMGPNRLDSFVDLLVEKQLGVLVRPTQASDYDWYSSDIAAAANAGVLLGFTGNDPNAIRVTAAAAVQAGLPAAKAMQALTSDAAKLVGMSEGAGRFAVGEPADLVVWSGSPLNLAARPLAVIVDGKLVDSER